ncbi:hypothetical protein HYT00_00505 [Candidatus Giovannonibacteria bacterium]|nr:hypothetical protein [Candidatus Giovannonibacteria bacterium]
MIRDNKTIYIWAVIIAIAVLGGAYYIWKDIGKINKPGENISVGPTPTPTPTPSNQNKPSPTPSVVKKAVPALPFPVEIRAELSEDSKKMALTKIETITNKLRQDPSIDDLWVDLGLQRKFIGDFMGAKEAWEYASYLKPNYYVPYNNLGDLYTYNLNDYKKAEANYKMGIKVDDGAGILYQKLYELYRFKLKDDVRAKSILEEGITKNPGSSEHLKAILKEWTG